MLHENENYSVHTVEIARDDIAIVDNLGVPYDSGYALINKQTGVIELVRSTLPDVLFNAEHLNKILTEKPFMWLDEKDVGATVN
jgi:hypothetical protein